MKISKVSNSTSPPGPPAAIRPADCGPAPMPSRPPEPSPGHEPGFVFVSCLTSWGLRFSAEPGPTHTTAEPTRDSAGSSSPKRRNPARPPQKQPPPRQLSLVANSSHSHPHFAGQKLLEVPRLKGESTGGCRCRTPPGAPSDEEAARSRSQPQANPRHL